VILEVIFLPDSAVKPLALAMGSCQS